MSTGPGNAAADLADVPVSRAVVDRKQIYSGQVLSLQTDTVDLGDGQEVIRDVVRHPGAVGILALDDQERLLFVQQYRHPVASLLWEPPAGLLDVPGEDPLAAAQRELYEEAGYRARRWDVLVDLYTTPGGNDEALRLYLARDLSPVEEGNRHEGNGEERDMPTAWIALDSAVDLVLSGSLHNPSAVAGVLAVAAARTRGWSALRPASSPWRKHTSR